MILKPWCISGPLFCGYILSNRQNKKTGKWNSSQTLLTGPFKDTQPWISKSVEYNQILLNHAQNRADNSVNALYELTVSHILNF